MAFFLNYCDYAQEWGRRVFRDLMKGEKKDAKNLDEQKFETNLFDIEMGDMVLVTIHYYNLDMDKDTSKVEKIGKIRDGFQARWRFRTPTFNIRCVDKGKEKVFCIFTA